jgi:Na+-transporting methylmalonyl-CoA/oxaloacetate decarboxylase gamma subunit
MWADAFRVAALGFSVVLLTLALLAISVKIMSFFCKLTQRKGGK